MLALYFLLYKSSQYLKQNEISLPFFAMKSLLVTEGILSAMMAIVNSGLAVYLAQL